MLYFFIIISLFNTIYPCDEGYLEINNLCFFEDDILLLQKTIDNSYQSGIDLDCSEGDDYCGSPNPYMDDPESWFSKIIDGVSYDFANGNGIVEPLELGMQQWQNGRLKTIMCGAYIYCQLSGPIPEDINNLTELETFRFEGNYFSGIIPDSICDLDIDYNDYLTFDVSHNRLCPPYPDCIDTDYEWWGQYDEECTDCSSTSGDLNLDNQTNIQDIVIIVNCILNGACDECSDINDDQIANVLDVIVIINMMLGQNF